MAAALFLAITICKGFPSLSKVWISIWKIESNEVYSQKFISNQEDIISQGPNIISQREGNGCKGIRVDMTEWP